MGHQAGGVIVPDDRATDTEQQVGPSDLKAVASGIGVAPDGARIAFTHNFKADTKDVRIAFNCLALPDLATGREAPLVFSSRHQNLQKSRSESVN